MTLGLRFCPPGEVSRSSHVVLTGRSSRNPIIGRTRASGSNAGHSAPDTGLRVERLITLETNIDDLNPQVIPVVMDRLLQQGALDVWVIQGLMKKGRPASFMNVLGKPEDRDKLARILIKETTTLGVRVFTTERLSVDREIVETQTPWGPVRCKIGFLDGEPCNIQLEFEDCLRISKDHGIPVLEVLDWVKSAYMLSEQERKAKK